ncbi:MAG: GH36-type glycosyl hydrolase domain-containing protein, partial [Treponemataceae bacterium]
GLEHTCSDDALWLIPAIAEYIKETGDDDFIEQKLGYADGGQGSVYEHLKKILDFSAEHVGKTGVCKGLRADWNDCLNLGGGESALVSFLHYWALESFLELAKYYKKDADVQFYGKMAENVKKVCENELWDGEWYIRGITKKGIKIGTQKDTEGKFHLESNAWAVASGVANEERSKKTLENLHTHLATPWGLHLNAPSYGTPNDDIGFLTRVYKGIKENGAIFSHPNPWAWVALSRIGGGNRAVEYYDAICPARQNDLIEVRQAEPYSYCQFVMGKEHSAHGRARHPWLTGSAGWAYYAATHYILGIRVEFKDDQFVLVVDPCISSEWKEFSANRRWKNAEFDIRVKNPKGLQKGKTKITLNGKEVPYITTQAANSKNTVVVEIV